MTTIAIIGGGIAARSLLFVLAKRKIPHKILVFYSYPFAFPCSLHSTAIVAPRGISTGHSPLGDVLVEGFDRFSRHVREDRPSGVIEVPQYTGALTKLEAFKKRYPDGKEMLSPGPVTLKEKTYIAEERAYLIRPRDYMDWLLSEARTLDLEIIPSFVTDVSGHTIRTQDERTFTADEIVFTAGVSNPLWFSLFGEKKAAKSVQGCYLEFSGIHLGATPFSLTLEGDNVIYDADRGTLLVGSTTNESFLELPAEKQLREIHARVSSRLVPALPHFDEGTMKTGLREKASRREAYILRNGHLSAIGGLYKNGYRLGLTLSERLLQKIFG